MKGYATIWCGDFSLQAILRRTRRTVPVALVDDSKRQSIILARNAVAAARGVNIGMPTVQALGRAAALQIERPSSASELSASRFLLETALSWVPLLEETAPGILTLDLSTQPNHQWYDSAVRIHHQLSIAGLEVAIGLGETPSLSRIASQTALFREEPVWHLDPAQRLAQLDRLPLAMAELDAELCEKLELWGIFTLGAFARLQREAIAARLGDVGVELWLRLTGRLHRPLRAAALEALFEESHDFEYEVSERDPLLFLLHRFVERLIQRVSLTNHVAIAVHLLMVHADDRCYARRLRLPEPTLDDTLIYRVVSGHLEVVEMTAAVCAVRLRFEIAEAVASQRQLFGSGLKNLFQYRETLKRLRDLVGVDRIGSPRKRDDHRVDRFDLVPLPKEICEFSNGTQAPSNDLFESGTTGVPPAQRGPVFYRYRTPKRITITLRDAQPLMIESSTLTGIVTKHYGPWKSAGHWWHEGNSWNRAEWDIELMNRGIYRLIESDGNWFIEGYYD